MRRFILLAVLFVSVSAFAAPVPMPPAEDLRTFTSQREFDTETWNRASKLIRTDDLNRGTRWVFDKGWYATYFTDDGVMLLSNIPDGRLRYGYFADGTGLPIRWNDKDVPEVCAMCHNRNRER